MGLFKKIKKGFKKIVSRVSKTIKKIAKPIVKVQKKIWKGIKKVGGKIMKAINKAGIIGQIGLMLIMPYAFTGLGTLIGAAGGGIGATWTGFGNWASSMMGSSSAFAKTVGTIAKGIHSAGAIVGRGIQSVAGFVDKGFQAFSNATGLGNPIEGFSNAIKQGYADSFSATNNFLFSGTDFGATAEQLKSAGVKVPTKPLPKINMEAMEFGEAPKFEPGESLETYLERTKPAGIQMPSGDFAGQAGYQFNPETGQLEFFEGLKPGEIKLPTVTPEGLQQTYESLGIETKPDLTLQLDTTTPKTFAQKAGDVLGTVSNVLNVVGKGKSVYDQFQEQEQAYGEGFGQLGGEGRGIQDINFFRSQGQIGLNLNAYSYDMQRYAYG